MTVGVMLDRTCSVCRIIIGIIERFKKCQLSVEEVYPRNACALFVYTPTSVNIRKAVLKILFSRNMV